jgi:hypothetical protein
LDQLTSKQISEWEAYDRIDPIGTWREDFRMAYLSSLITNLTISVHGKKGAKTTSPIDFMPEWDKDAIKLGKPTQTVEEMKQILLGIAKTQNRKPGSKPPVRKTPTR